jgi:hypothetical protein
MEQYVFCAIGAESGNILSIDYRLRRANVADI